MGRLITDASQAELASRDGSDIERASSGDLAYLAMDNGKVPQQFAVILILERPDDLSLQYLQQLIEDRILAVPRLRQRLIKVPLGCGSPIWADDLDFRIDRHVRVLPCRAPGDERALLDTALSVIMTPLPRQAPLWSVVLITDLAAGSAAVVVILHHVLADGLGGLSVLAALVDPGSPPAAVPFPRPTPAVSSLARDAWLTRLNSVRQAAGSWRLFRRSISAGGGFRPDRAAPCSIVQRTGPRRSMAVVKLDPAGLAAAAHRYGATTNDAVLVAVAAALNQVLVNKGESVDPIVITVPVSGRRAGGTSGVGNLVSPMIVKVPTSGGLPGRLAYVDGSVRAHKEAATGPPPIALLGALFRLLARIGAYRFYMNHQRRFHTLMTHVRGPVQPVRLGGHEITAAIPVAVGEGGNVTVSFEVLSYAGVLTITVIADPDHGPDLDDLARRLQSELNSISLRSLK